MIQQRNESIDILKGIGILFVLTAHSLGGFVSKFAYTFHMPLFFIIAGLFISEYATSEKESFSSWWKRKSKKDARRLLLPALFTTGIILVISLLYYVFQETYLRNPVDLIWKNHPKKMFGNIIMLGNLWFLFALFFAKQFFYVINHLCENKWLPIACFLFGGIAVIVGTKAVFPFSILAGISVLPFMWAGYYLKHHGGIEKGLPNWFYFSIIIWIIYIFYGRMQVGGIRYSWGYLPDIIAACGGSLFFYLISRVISLRTKYLRRILSFLGMNTMILICAPGLETYCFPMTEIIPNIPLRFVFVIIGKVGWCVLAIYGSLKIPFLRDLFCAKAPQHS